MVSEGSHTARSLKAKGSSHHPANRSSRQLWCTPGLCLFFISRFLGCLAATNHRVTAHASDNICFPETSFWGYLGSSLFSSSPCVVEGKWNAFECEGHRPPKSLVGAQEILPRELWSYSLAQSLAPVLSPFNAIHLHKTTSPTHCSSQRPFPACEQSWMLWWRHRSTPHIHSWSTHDFLHGFWQGHGEAEGPRGMLHRSNTCLPSGNSSQTPCPAVVWSLP